ncbi:MAG: hypothetical protein RLZZ196_774 [Bacteroidota bacterium]|jgi:hypothetical protein
MQIVWTILAALGALAMGRSVIIWSFLTYAFGWWILVPLLLIGNNKRVLQRRLDTLNNFNNYLVENTTAKGYKDFNTVDDLMKQLENK